MGSVSARADRFVARLMQQHMRQGQHMDEPSSHAPKMMTLYQRLRTRQRQIKQRTAGR